jgi:hypothetical protein
MGNDNHVVVSHKLCGFQGCVGGRIVMMKKPVVVAPKFQSFSSHTFSQASQNITVQVKVRVDRTVREQIHGEQSPSCRFYTVLMMVYNTQNYWVFELRPSSGF